MLAVLNTLTPGCQNEFTDFHKAEVRIAVVRIMAVKTWWNSTMKLLQRVHWLREFTCEWLENPKYGAYWPALPNTELMDHCEVCYGSVKAIAVLEALDVEKAYCDSASHYPCQQWHIRAYRCHYVSFAEEKDSMDERLILCSDVCASETVQILYWSYPYDWYASHFSAYPRSSPEVAFIYDVELGNEY